MKRKSFIVGIMLLCILLIGSSAMAYSYMIDFNDVSTVKYTVTGNKSDPTSRNYTLTIDASSNVTSANILGARPRRGSNSEMIGSYKTYTTCGSYDKVYYESAMQVTSVFFAMKKDNSSTTTARLAVTGSFTP